MIGTIALWLMALSTTTPATSACFEDRVVGGVAVKQYVGDRACHSFNAPETLSGIWINEFEGSRFLEGAGKNYVWSHDGDKTWLNWDDKTVGLSDKKLKLGHAYRLTIIGQKASEKRATPLEGYGHFGMFSDLVLVNRIIEIEDLGPIRRSAVTAK